MVMTAVHAAEYRGLLTEVNRMAQTDLVALWQQLERLDRDRLFRALSEGVPEIVELYRATTADTAGLFYAETQGLELDTTATFNAMAVNTYQLERNLRWAFYGVETVNTLSLIGGIVQKHIVDGSRDYGLQVMGRQGWVRDARPEACTFCRLLATRGMAGTTSYSSEDAAVVKGGGDRVRNAKPGRSSRPVGEAFHENCMCLPVLASEYALPEHVAEWSDQYDQAYENVGNASDLSAILAEMRRLSGHRH